MTRAITCFTLLLLFTCTAFGVNFTVTKVADTNDGACDADCSLREAIAAANASADNDVIEFAALFQTAQTITLSGADLIITNNGTLTINGTGAAKLTVSGNNTSRVFTNNTGAVTTINDVRVTGGTGVSTIQTGRGGGIYNNGGTLTLNRVIITGNSAANGGGTNNAGTATLNINNSVISNNTATGSGGGMQNFSGNFLNVRNTAISGNACNSTLTGGGAIQANGTLTFTNVTFTDNAAPGGDGGALFYNGQGLTLNNVTISRNSAGGGGSGGLHKSTSTLNANVRNTIIAGNTGSASPDATGAFNSQGSNIIAVVGTSTGWIGSDHQNVNPLLSPAGFYGGPGLTLIPLSGSPAIDGGHNCVIDLSCSAANPPVAITTDQRGATRPFNTTVDIGAVEISTDYRAVLKNAVWNQGYGEIIVSDMNGFNYSVSSGGLPPGLQLTIILPSRSNLGGILSIQGTPTQTGTFDFSLTASNGTNSAVINYRIIVAGTPATVSGRILSSAGSYVPRAVVTISNTGGVVDSTTTNSFGYFTFTGIPTGQTCTVSVQAKGYTFTPLSFQVTGDVIGFVMTSSGSPFHVFEK